MWRASRLGRVTAGDGAGFAVSASVPVVGCALVRVIEGSEDFGRCRRFVSAPRDMTGGNAPAAGAWTRFGVLGDAAAGRFDVICVVLDGIDGGQSPEPFA